MTLATKRAQASVAPGDGPGEFDMILSNGTKDRDGEILHPEDWAQPLPDTIPINANHSNDVSDIVGSGKPFIDNEGNLRVTGTFAATPLAQHVRTLVNEGHLRSVSVEFCEKRMTNRLSSWSGVRSSTFRPIHQRGCWRQRRWPISMRV
jgi:hypothetical protein